MKLLACLGICLLTTAVQAQSFPDIYQVDRNTQGRTCYLPMIYFLPQSAEIAPEYLSDLAFIAAQLHKHKKLRVRLVIDVAPHPTDFAARLLAEERLIHLTWLLQDQYDIKPKRILKDDYRDLSLAYLRGPSPDPHPLEKRRVKCECVFGKR